MTNKGFALMAAMLLAFGSVGAAQSADNGTELASGPLAEKIFHTILWSPRYGVFDAISFDLSGDHVTLTGYVRMPITGLEVSERVAKIDGVGKVTNKIENLPLSSLDDAIRRQLYRKIFQTADLYRYAWGVTPSIRIIVKNGRVTLAGTVDSKEDARLALLAARGISGVFSLESKLLVQ